MINTATFYKVAAEENIPVILLEIPETGSMCIQTETQRCYIGIDYNVLKNETSRRVHLAHELGHCVTGSFYNRWAARDVRQKHEYRADKWAIKHTIPEAELNEAVKKGYTEVWELAEHFGVTEEFMRKAICWYKYGTLSTELYF